MKNAKVIVLLLIVLILTSCTKEPLIRDKIGQMATKYCEMYVEIADPITKINNWNSKLINYLTSTKILLKIEKMQKYAEEIKSVANLENKEDVVVLKSIEGDLKTLYETLAMAKECKETGKYLLKDITYEERLEMANVLLLIKSSLRSNKDVIKFWKLHPPIDE